MNEHFPLEKKQTDPSQEDTPIFWKEPTEEEYRRAVEAAVRAHPEIRATIMPRYLHTMYQYTCRNLGNEKFTPDTLTISALDKAITAAFDPHSGSIKRDRRPLYRRAIHELFGKVTESEKSQQENKQGRYDMLNAARQRRDDDLEDK